MDKQEKNTPFKVPEGYFEQLPLNVSEKIDNRDKGFLGISPLFSKPIWLAAPTVFVLLLLMLVYKPWESKPSVATSIDMELAQVSNEEIKAYLLENGITEIELFEHFEEYDATDKVLTELPDISAEELEGLVDTYDIETLF
jgi:hypothetical protein